MKTISRSSVEDYHKAIAAGVLSDRRVQLLAGEIVEMSPETPQHYNTAKRGTKYLEELLRDRAEIRFNGPVTLADSEPEPDIAIVRSPGSLYDDRHPQASDIFWLVEVAKTSFAIDSNLKASIYARAKIPEYWVLDLSSSRLLVFRNPEGDRYREMRSFTSGTVQPLAFPDVRVSVDRLAPIKN